jgi:hypothetical protein
MLCIPCPALLAVAHVLPMEAAVTSLRYVHLPPGHEAHMQSGHEAHMQSGHEAHMQSGHEAHMQSGHEAQQCTHQ